jgi:two-component system response regulator DevR
MMKKDTSEEIRVLLADDHAVVLAGLRMLFSEDPHLTVVADADTPERAIDKARAYTPDVVVMDIRFGPEGDLSGIDACREIRSSLAGTRVIMFTSHSEREAVLDSVLAGASGFLTKNVGPSQVIDAIKSVARGESLLDPSVTGAVLSRLEELTKRSAKPSSDGDLTARELDVLKLIGEGLTNKEIAERLVVSPFTARNHVIRILDKLGFSRRTEAAAHAVRLGLLAKDDPSHR